jgi:superoxide dismutase
MQLCIRAKWEHAYTVDFKVTERAKDIDAFTGNGNSDSVAKRFG